MIHNSSTWRVFPRLDSSRPISPSPCFPLICLTRPRRAPSLLFHCFGYFYYLANMQVIYVGRNVKDICVSGFYHSRPDIDFSKYVFHSVREVIKKTDILRSGWKFYPFLHWNLILWYSKHILFHCKGSQNAFFMSLAPLLYRYPTTLWQSSNKQ